MHNTAKKLTLGEAHAVELLDPKLGAGMGVTTKVATTTGGTADSLEATQE
jgi:hypothetical protein